MCVNTPKELFYKTRSTSGSISSLLCVYTTKVLFYTTRSTSGSISTLLCMVILQRSSSTRQGAPVGVYLPCCVCQYSKGALLQDKEHQWEYIFPVVCLYYKGALLHDKEHQWEYNYPLVYGNTAEELFNKTRSTGMCQSTLLCVLLLQRSSSTRQGAPLGVYLPCCVCKYCRGTLLQDKEHKWEYIYPIVCGNTAEKFFYKTRSISGSISTLLCV